MTLVPNETEQALNRQHDVYAAAHEEYRKKIVEQAAEIERLNAEDDELRIEITRLNFEVERLTRTNQAKREHRDKLLEAKIRAASRIEQLEKALREISDMIPHAMPDYTHQVWKTARAALEGKP